jgi:hypothetical protein
VNIPVNPVENLYFSLWKTTCEKVPKNGNASLGSDALAFKFIFYGDGSLGSDTPALNQP